MGRKESNQTNIQTHDQPPADPEGMYIFLKTHRSRSFEPQNKKINNVAVHHADSNQPRHQLSLTKSLCCVLFGSLVKQKLSLNWEDA